MLKIYIRIVPHALPTKERRLYILLCYIPPASSILAFLAFLAFLFVIFENLPFQQDRRRVTRKLLVTFSVSPRLGIGGLGDPVTYGVSGGKICVWDKDLMAGARTRKKMRLCRAHGCRLSAYGSQIGESGRQKSSTNVQTQSLAQKPGLRL
jgi:hypothetical protein